MRPKSSKDVKTLAWSPDGHFLALGGSGLTILETQSGNEVFKQSHLVQVTSLAWAPDGKSIVLGSADGRIQILAFEE
jgi:WD40 repeat protein